MPKNCTYSCNDYFLAVTSSIYLRKAYTTAAAATTTTTTTTNDNNASSKTENVLINNYHF